MYPAEDHEIFTVDIVEKRALVDSLASVRCAFLIWNHKLGDEQCIGDESATEYATGLEIGLGVRKGKGKEAMAEIWRQPYGS